MFRDVFQMGRRAKGLSLFIFLFGVLILSARGIDNSGNTRDILFAIGLPGVILVLLIDRNFLAIKSRAWSKKNGLLMVLMFGFTVLNMVLCITDDDSVLALMLQSLVQSHVSPWQAKALSAVEAAAVTSLLLGAAGPWIVRTAVGSETDFGAFDRLKAFVATLPKLVAAALLLAAVNLLAVFSTSIGTAVEGIATDYWTGLLVSMPVYIAFSVLMLSFMLFLAAALVEAYLRLDPEPLFLTPQGEPG
ncbi:hypothetical protein [Rhodobium gokarnense]|uniref:Uncharacterized protein n=1 Tax=Rhodobium gokarnense TaxID=364296 RepID=A0ABT3HD55_9HYPH|nr:hypothetical protein [Rhodobium gokarnense]MCW2308254.1 hypothetical protein [Rhodobium gokarnense]